MPKWFLDPPTEVWGEMDDEERRKVDRLTRRAETFITAKFPDIQKRVDAGTLAPEVIADVVEEMVTRAIDYDDRGGVAKESLPEWSLEYESGSGLGKGSRLFLTTDEYALLAPARRRPRLTTIQLWR
ncbi:hypothetical protein [Corynebacterium sanguinis]|uniref:Phage protein Gp19/Gp15/Gp42 n=1 Tax=Corynebacterium sanguinis TaxID=2594913 RepID=A0A6C1U430_9CORY|nr:hypothetical protein [Corynebacterium sanguinis]TVS29801.1 hypothetical protein EKI59_02450 [Corynebacterium sanguinis]